MLSSSKPQMRSRFILSPALACSLLLRQRAMQLWKASCKNATFLTYIIYKFYIYLEREGEQSLRIFGCISCLKSPRSSRGLEKLGQVHPKNVEGLEMSTVNPQRKTSPRGNAWRIGSKLNSDKILCGGLMVWWWPNGTHINSKRTKSFWILEHFIIMPNLLCDAFIACGALPKQHSNEGIQGSATTHEAPDALQRK